MSYPSTLDTDQAGIGPTIAHIFNIQVLYCTYYQGRKQTEHLSSPIKKIVAL